MVHNGQIYKTSYNGQNLEDMGIYLTDHDAFKGPDHAIGVFEPDVLLSGFCSGEQLYASAEPKTINLSLIIDNANNPEASIDKAIQLFFSPGILVLEERPDRGIYCFPSGGIQIRDSFGITKMSITLRAHFPYFLSLESKVFEAPGVLVLEGNVRNYPRISIQGPVADPYISIHNMFGDFSRRYEGLTLGAQDYLEIDTLNDIERLGGQSVSNYAKGSKLVFSPGSNTVDTNSSRVIIYYQETYL